jgi:hypothetical protein
MIFTFLPDIGKNFIGNSFCITHYSVMQFIHILYIFIINSVFYKPLEEKSRGVKCGDEGAREWVSFFLFNAQETPCPKRHRHDKSEVVHHLTGKLFLQIHDTKHCSPS